MSLLLGQLLLAAVSAEGQLAPPPPPREVRTTAVQKEENRLCVDTAVTSNGHGSSAALKRCPAPREASKPKQPSERGLSGR